MAIGPLEMSSIPDINKQPGHEREEEMARLLAQILPDEAIVYLRANVYFSSPNLPKCPPSDLDILVLWPSRALLLYFEVKSGQFKTFVKQCGDKWRLFWTRPNNSSTDPQQTFNSPFEQMNHNRMRIQQCVNSHFSNKLTIIGACMFPDCHFETPPAISEDVSHLNQLDCLPENLEKAIDRVIMEKFKTYRLHQLPALSKADVQTIRRKILGEDIETRISFGAAVRSVEGRILDLSHEQQVIAQLLTQIYSPIIITGGAGTGKTLLLLRSLRTLVDRGIRTLLLCFNRLLAETLRNNLAQDLKNFAHLYQIETLEEFLHRVGGSALVGELGNKLQTPESEALPLKNLLTHAILDHTTQPGRNTDDGFGALLVDEAQDFQNWIVDGLYQYLEAQPANPEPTQIIFSLDPAQSIFSGHAPTWHQDHIQIKLTRNLRNAAPIRNLAVNLTSRDSQGTPTIEHAPEVEFHEFSDSEADDQLAHQHQIFAVREFLWKLVNNHKVKPQDILLLGLHANNLGILIDLQHLSKRNIDVVRWQPGKTIPAKSIRATTVQAAKGLEAPVVVLCDIGLKKESSRAYKFENLYVGVTRARSLLFLFHRKGYKVHR